MAFKIEDEKKMNEAMVVTDVVTSLVDNELEGITDELGMTEAELNVELGITASDDERDAGADADEFRGTSFGDFFGQSDVFLKSKKDRLVTPKNIFFWGGGRCMGFFIARDLFGGKKSRAKFLPEIFGNALDFFWEKS